MNKEKVYIYKGIKFIPRKRAFKPYRIKAIGFLNKYNEFENSYCSALQSEIQKFLLNDKTVSGKIITAKNAGDYEKISKAIGEALLCNPDYAMKTQELIKKKAMAKELFLITDEAGNASEMNAKELCKIMLEDSEKIDHTPESEKDYLEYMTFLNEVMNDFFMKFSR
jgi:hypothetical protein